MPRPYSIDFRWRIVWLSVVNHWDANDISQFLCVSERTVRRLVTLFQQTGDIKPKSYRHGSPKLMGDHEQLLLLKLILSYPGIYMYLHEIQAKLTATLRVTISPATICSTSKFIGCTRQVLQHIALQQDEEQRARFMAEISVYDPSMLLWIDVSGCDRRHSMCERVLCHQK